MRLGSPTRWVASVTLAFGCLFFAMSSAAWASYDDLPGEAPAGEAPWTSATVFDSVSHIGSTDAFTIDPAEAPVVFRACGNEASGTAWGTKDAWVRFNAGVAGNLLVAATTHGTPTDIFYMVYKSSSTNPLLGDLHQFDCEDSRTGTEESSPFGYNVPAHTILFVQVLVQCSATGECTEAEEEAAIGGDTSVRLRFTPANADGDEFADTLDHCPSVPGAFLGCPDSDGDGVGDADDACPTVKGRAPNGCRLPDEDGDGYGSVASGGNDCNDDDVAVHPGAVDVPGDGIDQNCDGHDSPQDADGDRYAAVAYGGTDCDDANGAVHPGAVDVPGDGIDQNCDGHDAAYPILRNEIGRVFAYSPRQRRTVGFLSPFKIGGPLVAGMSVRLICAGRGCPISRQATAIRKDRPGGLEVGKDLVRKILAPRASVTLLITRPGYIGEAVRFTTRRHGKMRIQKLCVPPGSTTPEKRCA